MSVLREIGIIARALDSIANIEFRDIELARGQSGRERPEATCLERLDDLEDLSLAEQRLIDIRSGKTQTLSQEDVMKHHGLEY